MQIIVFFFMIVATLVGIGYPLFRRTALSVALPSARGQSACAGCGRALEPDEAFCPTCGAPAGAHCAHCGRRLDGDELFCPGCGKKVGGAR